jgi:hypothetical protein
MPCKSRTHVARPLVRGYCREQVELILERRLGFSTVTADQSRMRAMRLAMEAGATSGAKIAKSARCCSSTSVPPSVNA